MTKLQTFTSYLTQKDYSKQSIKEYSRAATVFCHWLKKRKLEPQQVTHNQIMDYIKALQTRGVSMAGISNSLNYIKAYYRYLKSINEASINPITGIKLQGVKTQKLHHILKPEELSLIYQTYPYKTPHKRASAEQMEFTRIRYQAMLGLLIYQGIRTSELARIQLQHININGGTITIPWSPKGNERKLPFAANQIIAFHQFLIHDYSVKTEEEHLFYNGKLPSINNAMAYLLRKVKKEFPEITSYSQIRTSVVTEWIKSVGLRKAQYKAGHRYVSSTERYQVNDLETLQNEVNLYQPVL
jgi:site-specific recombinase XerD